ncbi:MAG: EamA family transporter [Chlamydiales bacterium]|jgi:drug/metabolite transporter (DMT)-like permease|nr:EamA family transporter [Chlamydiales bacterium]
MLTALKQNKNLQGTLLILASAIGYATVAIFGKLAILEQMTLFNILFFRFLGTAFFLFGMAYFSKQMLIDRKDALRCMAVGMVWDTSVAFFFLLSIERLGASLAAMLMYTYPVFVVLIQTFLRSEKLQRSQLVTLCFALIGTFLVIDPHFDSAIDPIGVLAGLLTGLGYAFYLTYATRWTAHVPALICSGYISLGSAFSFCIASLATTGIVLPPRFESYQILLAQIIFSTVIPLSCLYAGIRIIGPTKTALIFTLEPVTTVLLSLWFFDESFTLIKAIGAGIAVISILCLQLIPKKEQQPH